MKLKLKVAKELKRELKVLAKKMDQERPDYVINELKKLIEEKKELWLGKVETYPELLIERKDNLAELRVELEESEKSVEEQRAILKVYYKEHHMYLDYDGKNRKFENLILSLEEEEYYALNIIADNNERTIEAFVVEYLHRLVKTIK